MQKAAIFSLLVVALFTGPVASAQSYYPSYTTSSTPTYAPATSSSCPVITRDLSIGTRGSDVSTLQSFLVAQNYPGSGSWMITGYFGNATAAAVRNYQSQHNLPATGMADSATRAAIATCGANYNPYPSNNNSNYPYGYPSNNYQPYPNYPYNNTYPYGPTYPYSNRPYISYLSPASGEEGDKIKIYGSGFSDSDNTVWIDGKRISGLDASSDGTIIRFIVPRNLSSGNYANCNYGYNYNNYNNGYPYSCGGATYSVTVTNDAGNSSNPVPFTISSTSGDDPAITDLTGPSTLRPGRVGTWTLDFDPMGAPATITVDWDDNTQDTTTQTYARNSQSLSFNHVYYDTGSHRIEVQVRNPFGSDSKSRSVDVTGSNEDTSISSLSLDSGQIGDRITIRGSGFDPDDNTVHFGIGGRLHVSANSDGTRISFTIPSYISQCDVMPRTNCFYAQPVTPGDYQVYIENQNGTTNSKTFTVER